MMLPIAIAILKNLFGQKETRKDLNWESEENAGEAGERDWGPIPARWRSGGGDVRSLAGKVKGIHLLSTYYMPSILIITENELSQTIALLKLHLLSIYYVLNRVKRFPYIVSTSQNSLLE